MRGIIRVLTGYVRARVRDVAALQNRVQELEREVAAHPSVTGDGNLLRELHQNSEQGLV